MIFSTGDGGREIDSSEPIFPPKGQLMLMLGIIFTTLFIIQIGLVWMKVGMDGPALGSRDFWITIGFFAVGLFSSVRAYLIYLETQVAWERWKWRKDCEERERKRAQSEGFGIGFGIDL